jgi:hypothetical protein
MVRMAATVGRLEEMAESRRGVPVSVRVPPELARRMDRLIPKIAKDPAVATLGIVTRSTLVKLAILKGVEVLEQEYK